MIRKGLPRRTTPRALAAVALAAAICGGSAAAALAAPPDIRATWSAAACVGGTLAQCEAAPQYPQLLVIETENFATGEISGQGESTAHAHVYSLTGAIVGCTVTIKTSQPGYTSESVQTLSADGKKLQGTFSDSYGRISQPTFATREAGAGCNETEAERIARETAEKGKHPTGTQVICNYEFATSQNTCVASVGDGAATPTAPSGTVTFTTTSGGFGSGAKCSLQVVPSAPSISSCQLVYFTLYSGLPSITASYGGDATHAPSSGKTQYLGEGPPEETVGSEAGRKTGEFAGELVVETLSPALGAELEAAVEPKVSPPVPVELGLPGPDPSLSPESRKDLLRTESLAMLVDLGGAEDQAKIGEMSHSLDELTAQAEELMKSPDAAQQAEGQRLRQEFTKTAEAISGILKRQAEAQQAIIRGGGAVESSEKSLAAKLNEALTELSSTSSADQVKAQAAIDAAQKRLDAISKAIQQQTELSKEVVKGIKASVAARRGVKIATRRIRPFGRSTTRAAAVGKVVLKLKLSRSAIRQLAGRRSSLPVLLRVNMRLPSATVHGGVPRAVVRPVTLKRASGRKKK